MRRFQAGKPRKGVGAQNYGALEKLGFSGASSLRPGSIKGGPPDPDCRTELGNGIGELFLADGFPLSEWIRYLPHIYYILSAKYPLWWWASD